jgi:hypothetical protein
MKIENENAEKETSVSRRQILKIGALAGAGLIIGGKLNGSKARAQEPDLCPEMPPNLNPEPFVDDLPIPPTLRPTKRRYGKPLH